MAVVSLSNLWCTVGGFAMGNGLLTGKRKKMYHASGLTCALTAIDTLVAQAFTAATNSTTLGIILQRGLLIMACVAAPISILWQVFINNNNNATNRDSYKSNSGCLLNLFL